MIWDGYLVLAEDLASRDEEAARRSAVSRAYYGAFNPARRWVEENLEPIDNRAAHQQVWRAFRISVRADEGTRTKWETVGELGNSLRLLRNQADYADKFTELDRHAVEAVGTAKQILTLLPELELTP